MGEISMELGSGAAVNAELAQGVEAFDYTGQDNRRLWERIGLRNWRAVGLAVVTAVGSMVLPGEKPASADVAPFTLEAGTPDTCDQIANGIWELKVTNVTDTTTPAVLTIRMALEDGSNTAYYKLGPGKSGTVEYAPPNGAINKRPQEDQSVSASVVQSQYYPNGGDARISYDSKAVLNCLPNDTAPPTTQPPATGSRGDGGYRVYGTNGRVRSFGSAIDKGSMESALTLPVVGGANTPSGEGYWMVAGDGGIFAFGDAQFYGSTGNIKLNKPIVGMTSTPDGKGYWMVASDGGIFAYGNAKFKGSTGNMRLNQPVVGMAATPSGEGYWLVASDGGIFAFGDAQFYGSTGNIKLNKAIVGMTRTSTGKGYWLVASDGGIFAYGDAQFRGSTGGISLAKPIVGMSNTSSSGGYWLAGGDGNIFAFGDAVNYGSATNMPTAAMDKTPAR